MKAKVGDRVRVHYTLKIDDEVFESSVGAKPIEFVIGDGEMIPGFEEGVIDMSPGETKTICILAEDAYGEHDENKVFEFDRRRAPEGFEPEIGQIVQMYRPDGKSFMVTVVDITDNYFRMDANHPLAGKDLTFDIELVEIVS
ncbi:MAG: peptidylprolyl isomerase [Thermodesulfovibrionia bacterium]